MGAIVIVSFSFFLEYKLMKHIVPYTQNEKDLIEKSVGEDFSDTIPDEHDADAQYVVDEFVGYIGDSGRYTGWWKKGEPNGRGTLRGKDGTWRKDSIWKNGFMHGKGRRMRMDDGMLYEGIWNEDEAAADNSVKRYSKAAGKKIIKSLMKGDTR